MDLEMLQYRKRRGRGGGRSQHRGLGRLRLLRIPWAAFGTSIVTFLECQEPTESTEVVKGRVLEHYHLEQQGSTATRGHSPAPNEPKRNLRPRDGQLLRSHGQEATERTATRSKCRGCL